MADTPVARSADSRVPKEHGLEFQVSEVIDLGGPMARITRTTYAHHKWTKVVLMVPADHDHGQPAESMRIDLNDSMLTKLLEALAWPK